MQPRLYMTLDPVVDPKPTPTKGMIGLGSARSAKRTAVRVDEMSDSEAQTRNRAGKPTAPVFPLRLIRPARTGGALKGKAKAPWGLAAVGALSSPCTGKGATVAILDSGIQASHEAFAHIVDRLEQRDFSGEGPEDVDGHGTHCAGTVFGGTVDGVRIGVAPGVSRALVAKIFDREGSCDTKNLLQAIYWAAGEGAHVVSMSLGMDFVGYQAELMRDGMPKDIATSMALEGYLQNARLFSAVAKQLKEQSIVLGGAIAIVAATGNESRRDDDKAFSVAVAPPAAGDGVVSVGALRKVGKSYAPSPFSNSGPLVTAPGSGIASARLGGGLEEMDGTSMATPHVAGVAALWVERWLATKQLNPATFAERLISETREVPGDFADVGSGIIWSPQ